MSIRALVGVVSVLVLIFQSVNARDCNFMINGRIHFYRDGENFTLPSARCQVHRCNNGQDSILTQGCEFEGKCRDINSEFVGTSCATYTCTMPYRNYFLVTPIIGGCKDYYNSCRQPGETFPYNYRGTYKARCTCEINGANTQYQCGF